MICRGINNVYLTNLITTSMEIDIHTPLVLVQVEVEEEVVVVVDFDIPSVQA